MKTYLPDTNGYFVCKPNLIITNIELCKKQKSAEKDMYSDNYIANMRCKSCDLTLKTIKTKSLAFFNELEEELKEHINLIHEQSKKPANIYFGKR